ncbi:hypothetical protein NDU88_002640 [Pleurodeles waltl]|uniref:Uncharacterized protein n=1 Tax=Pleurodeles waltl TaxID=8319 RepID=A0AAV7Q798_PLEWA|nr:hypothetical protein NDU88_002640 [Pleurodeles waltl]
MKIQPGVYDLLTQEARFVEVGAGGQRGAAGMALTIPALEKIKRHCDGLTPSRSIPPYPWGTSTVVVPHPDADRSGTYLHPGDVGLRKALLAIARERRGEREVGNKMRDTAVPKRTAAVSVEAALQEAAAALGPPAAAEEAEPAPDTGPTATPGGAAEEGGRTVQQTLTPGRGVQPRWYLTTTTIAGPGGRKTPGSGHALGRAWPWQPSFLQSREPKAGLSTPQGPSRQVFYGAELT